MLTCSIGQNTSNVPSGWVCKTKILFLISGCIDNRLQWPHGKTLGGGTNINYMIWVRGNQHDFDRWEAMGNPGWSYEDILPYYLKLEDDQIKLGDKNYHSKKGPVSVTDIPYRTKIVDAYVKGAEQDNFTYVDYNGKQQMGVSGTVLSSFFVFDLVGKTRQQKRPLWVKLHLVLFN